MSVTGLVKRDQVLTNATAQPGQKLAISKPLGTGIVTTAAKFDKCSEAEISAAISAMTTLNKSAMEAAHSAGATCATDVTGFGLVGHLGNITRESGVRGVVDLTRLPTLPGVERMVAEGCLTGGAGKNQLAVGERLMIPTEAPYWLVQVALDPQSSGGLLIACDEVPNGFVEIGWIESGHGEVELRSS
jgi:selenide,water dikinase